MNEGNIYRLTSYRGSPDLNPDELHAHQVAKTAEPCDCGSCLTLRHHKEIAQRGAITVEDGKSINNELDVVEGMQFDRGYLSPYLINNPEKQVAIMEDPYVLLFYKKVSNIRGILKTVAAVVEDRDLPTGWKNATPSPWSFFRRCLYARNANSRQIG
jgi:hypothetical protein